MKYSVWRSPEVFIISLHASRITRITNKQFKRTIFSARQHMYMLSALYAIARPSVCLSLTRVNQSKTVEDLDR